MSTLIKRIEVGKSSRVENKEYIGEIVTEMMLSIIKVMVKLLSFNLKFFV